VKLTHSNKRISKLRAGSRSVCKRQVPMKDRKGMHNIWHQNCSSRSMNTLTSKTKTGLVGMGLMSMSLALGCDLNDRDSAEREAQEDLREAQEEVREAQAELREAKAEIERLNARTQQKVE